MESKMEIVIKQNENQFGSIIEFNDKELSIKIKELVSEYGKMTYTDKQLQEAKTNRAELRKFREAWEKKRKSIKKSCLQRYDEFEVKYKKVLAEFDPCILKVDTTIKTFEEKKKQVKQDKLQAYYNKYVAELKDLITFQKIFNPQWKNASCSTSKAEGELYAKLEEIRNDLKSFESSIFRAEIQTVYLQTLDIRKAMDENTRMYAVKARFENAEKERLRLAAVKRIDRDVDINNIMPSEPFSAYRENIAPNIAPVGIPSNPPPSKNSFILETVTLKFSFQPGQKDIFKAFLIENKIKTEVIK